ncbi:MAG: thioredoxin family protein [Mollicutes bacterium]|nr:thioredoxin family protein [Mollicutes bacterium]
MKVLKYLVVLLAIFLIMPFAVFAEEEASNNDENTTEEASSNDNSDSKKVNVYFFRGEGCSHCAEAEEWFDSIKEEYSEYYNLIDYEVWYNTDNSDLMQKVADARGEEAEGVPYIIIGDKSWNGFDSSYEEDMINQIKSVYAQDVKDRYDIMTLLTDSKTSKKDSNASDILVLLAIIVVAGGIGFVIYKARKAN